MNPTVVKRRWFYKNKETYEDYIELYNDGTFILVKNENTGKYSFGMYRDFGTLYGFPAAQSCLTLSEVKERLNDFREISLKYDNVERLHVWDNMIEALKKESNE